VKYLIEELKVNISFHKETPLFEACQSGNQALVKYLIDLGTDVNIIGRYYGEIPLFIACKNKN